MPTHITVHVYTIDATWIVHSYVCMYVCHTEASWVCVLIRMSILVTSVMKEHFHWYLYTCVYLYVRMFGNIGVCIATSFALLCVFTLCLALFSKGVCIPVYIHRLHVYGRYGMCVCTYVCTYVRTYM